MKEKRCPRCMRPAETRLCPHCGADTMENNASHQLPVGTLLRGRYAVGRVLGQGGFGITYIGWDMAAETAVAIKEFFPSSTVNRDISQSRSIRVNTDDMRPHYQASKERFLREFEALSRLRDVPVTVDILDFFEENDTAYIIMELIRGMELKEYVAQKGGRLTPGETLELIRPLIRGLAHVHGAKLVHRDISPDNIMLQANGRVRLLDFGAVRTVLSPDAEKDLSRSTEAILKHGYAPMEQYRNRGGIGPWTDVYALCATVWFCLNGEAPPDALSLSMGDEFVDWTQIPGLAKRHQEALAKGMAVRATDRLPSMKALYDALYELPSPVPEPPKPPRPEPPREKPIRKKPAEPARTLPKKAEASAPSKKKRALWPVFAALCLVLAIGAALLLPIPTKPAPVPDPTVSQTDPSGPQPGAPLWESAVLMADPLAQLGDKDQILTVTFVCVDAAPGGAADLSADGSGSIHGWNDNGHVTIASAHGINGAQAAPRLFAGCIRLETVTFGGTFHTEDASSLEEMFLNCTALTRVDAETLDTGMTTSLRRMFSGCSGLEQVDVSGWDLGNAMDLSGLFADCVSLKTLDVSQWDLSGARNISGMFSYCSALEQLDVSGWDVSEVKDMMGLFLNCRSLSALEVGSWDTGSVTDMSSLFSFCSGVEALEVGGWDVSSVTRMNGMFAGCSGLKALDLSLWDTSSVTDVGGMFLGCPKLEILGIESWDLSRVTDRDGFMDPGRTVASQDWEELFP